MCEKHSDREIEFYCNDCKVLVCSRCMFFDHNGHQLSLLDDILPGLENEMDRLLAQYEKLQLDEAGKSESKSRKS